MDLGAGGDLKEPRVNDNKCKYYNEINYCGRVAMDSTSSKVKMTNTVGFSEVIRRSEDSHRLWASSSRNIGAERIFTIISIRLLRLNQNRLPVSISYLTSYTVIVDRGDENRIWLMK